MESSLNYWTNLSVEYANQRCYLDDLFRVYPLDQNVLRDVKPNAWKEVEAFSEQSDGNCLFEFW